MFHVKQFQQATGVSDDTLRRLQAYGALLEKWQRKINLVGGNTLSDLWRRHMLDSAQLYALLPKPDCRVIDLGSGAGFPGFVLAILGGPRVTLVESDGRKCAFLAEAMRVTETGASARLENRRIEGVPPEVHDVVTSRALAPLPALMELAQPFLGPDTVCLFPKGKKADEELTETEKKWMMRVRKIPSQSDPSGTILRLTNTIRRDD